MTDSEWKELPPPEHNPPGIQHPRFGTVVELTNGWYHRPPDGAITGPFCCDKHAMKRAEQWGKGLKPSAHRSSC